MLAKCVNPESNSNESQTPLLLAAIWGYERITSLLLESGANPDTRVMVAKVLY